MAVRSTDIMENLYYELYLLQKHDTVPAGPADSDFWSSNLPLDQLGLYSDGYPSQHSMGLILQILREKDGDPENRYGHIREGMVGPFPFERVLRYYRKASRDDKGEVLSLLGNRRFHHVKQEFERLDKKEVAGTATKPHPGAQDIAQLFRQFDAEGLRATIASSSSVKPRIVRRRQ